VKQRITTFVASGVLALALFGEAMAGPLEGGEAAYQRGDYETAVRLWRLSGDEGNVYAQFNLGLLYSSGEGVPQDYVQALIWFRKAADQGDARAQVMIRQILSSVAQFEKAMLVAKLRGARQRPKPKETPPVVHSCAPLESQVIIA
jgi:TPR repeat protein